jgi:1-acyl-sn-glycerol-3-phosphate acyltransferase
MSPSDNSPRTASTLPPALMDGAKKLFAPLRLVMSPKFIGIDRIPDTRPLLFVGNHTLYGMLDVPFLFMELYDKKGIYLRGLGDHLHFKVPKWGTFLRRFGVVDGTRENCARLMERGESILVFPGGAREVAKRHGEKYKLVWQERLGFARMAIAHGCTVIPFASVGVEDALDIVVDAEQMLATRVGRTLRRLGLREDLMLPIARGLGPTPLPRPERLYFAFGEPIATDGYESCANDDVACRDLRDRVRAAIEAGLAELKEIQRVDPHRALLPRLTRALDNALARRRARRLQEDDDDDNDRDSVPPV